MTKARPRLRLVPRPDGLLDAMEPLLLPVMAPRLQGYASPEGRLELSLWGSGRLGVIRFTPLEGPFVYGPNRIEAKGGGIYVATSAPVLVVRGARLKRIHPARSPAPWWMKIDAPKVVTEASGLKAAVTIGNLIAAWLLRMRPDEYRDNLPDLPDLLRQFLLIFSIQLKPIRNEGAFNKRGVQLHDRLSRSELPFDLICLDRTLVDLVERA